MRQITNVHMGIVNWELLLQFTYSDGNVDKFLFGVPMARQLQDGIGQVLEAIECHGVPRDGIRVRDEAFVRLIDGGQSVAEKN